MSTIYRILFVALSVLQGYLLFTLFPGNREISLLVIWLPMIQILFSTESHYNFYRFFLSSKTESGKNLSMLRYISRLLLQTLSGFIFAFPLVITFGLFHGATLISFPFIIVGDKVLDELQRYSVFVDKSYSKWFFYNSMRKIAPILALLAAYLIGSNYFLAFSSMYALLYIFFFAGLIFIASPLTTRYCSSFSRLVLSYCHYLILTKKPIPFFWYRLKVIALTFLSQQYSFAMRSSSAFFNLSSEELPLNLQFASAISLLPDSMVTTAQRSSMPANIPDRKVQLSTFFGVLLCGSLSILFLLASSLLQQLPYQTLVLTVTRNLLAPINYWYIMLWSCVLFLSSYYSALLEWKATLSTRFRLMLLSAFIVSLTLAFAPLPIHEYSTLSYQQIVYLRTALYTLMISLSVSVPMAYYIRTSSRHS